MNKKMLSVIASVFVATAAQAGPYLLMGTKVAGMGGASVTTSDAAFAAYHNPAILGKNKGFNMSISGGAAVQDDNLIDNIDRLATADITQTISSLDNLNTNLDSGATTIGDATWQFQALDKSVTDIQGILRTMSEGNNISVAPSAGLGIAYENFAIGGMGSAVVSLGVHIDGTRLDLAFGNAQTGNYFKYDPMETDLTQKFTQITQGEYEATSLEYAVNNKTSYVDVRGIAISEIPVAYGQAIPMANGDSLSLGITTKYMMGRAYNTRIDIDATSDAMTTEIQDNYVDTTTFGIDLGAIYEPKSVLENLKLGAVVKNINTPSFDTIGGDKIKLEPHIRVGASYELGEMLTLATDMDITKTTLGLKESQYFSAGLDFHPWSWISLRLGAMNNIADTEEGMIVTGGLALGTKWVYLETAVQAGLKSQEIDGQALPNYIAATAALNIKF